VKLAHSLVVDLPPADVFAFLADPANLPLWQSGLVEVTKENETTGVGARHREVRSILGKRIDQTLEVTTYEVGRRLDLAVVDGPVSLRVGHTLSEEAGGTRIDVVATGDPGGLFRLAGPVLARAVEHQSKGDFARLKRLLETS
jgi:carbon monoxide dehydrogenase subunit G